MIVETSYALTTPNLNVLLNRVVNDREIIYIKSQNGENVALIAADELQSLLETMRLSECKILKHLMICERS